MKRIVAAVIAIALMAFATPALAASQQPQPPIPTPPPASTSPEPPARFTQTIAIRERGDDVWQSEIEIRPGREYDVNVTFKNIGGMGRANLKVDLPLNIGPEGTISNITATLSSDGPMSTNVAFLNLSAPEPVTAYFVRGSATVTNASHHEGVMLGEHSDVIFSGIDLCYYATGQGASVSFAFETIAGTFPKLPVTPGYVCEYEIPTLFSSGFVFAHYAHDMDHGNYMPTRLEVLKKIHELAFPDGIDDEHSITNWAISSGLISGRGGNGNYAWKEVASQSEIYTILDNYARIFQGEAPARSTYWAAGFPEWAQPGVQRACSKRYFLYDYNPEEGMPYEVFVHILNHTAIGGGM